VSLWARPDVRLAGRIRELSASANPASRTYAARIALPSRPDWVQLGMSATVELRLAPSDGHAIPVSAVFQPYAQPGGNPLVWLLDQQGTSVSSVPIRLGAPVGETEVVAFGLHDGQRIVTAGASRLREGESVRPLTAADLGAPQTWREPIVTAGGQPR
jgi:multidrug efflux system membrane fusion protein